MHVLAADVTAEGAAERIRDRARELGGAEWLVNDAGVGWFGRFSAMPARRLAEMVRLNCEALVLLTHAVLPDLLAARRGTILNVASLAALTPTPFMSAYGATKAFVAAFSESLAVELRGSGVSVTAFCPGPVDTEFGDVSGYSARGRIARPPGRVGAHASARAAIAAAEAGEVVSVPGALNKMAAAAAWFLPRALSRRFADVVLRPTSRE